MVGDIVTAKAMHTLRCGSGIYPYAICVSLHPFILISEEGDMVWSATVEIENFEVFGKATPAMMKTVMDRLHRDSDNGRVKRG
jgi:hypothetical protein